MRGRKSKYESDIKPRFDEIKSWCSIGATDKEIIECLGISKDTFYSCKKKHPEFSELIKRARKKPLLEIKAALFKRAIGFQYDEIETVTDNEGRSRTRIITKTVNPDPVSAMILLKHWDKEGGWTNDPAMLELRKREVELKEKEKW